jgi:four helix bundle protein
VGRIRSYRDLIVWQKAMELSKTCYQIIERAPRRATRGTASQLLRAADKVAAQIAEGHGRPTRQDYTHYIGMARASIREVSSHLEHLERARGLRGPMLSLAVSLCDQCGRMLTNLHRRLRES